MSVEEFMAIAEAALQEALEGLLKSVQELDNLPRPLFKMVAEKLKERGKELFPSIPMGDGVALEVAVEASEIYYHGQGGPERRHLVLGLRLWVRGPHQWEKKFILVEPVFRISPRSLQSLAQAICLYLPSELPKEVLRVVEAVEAYAERARSLLREVEAEYAAALEEERETLEALKLRAVVQTLAEE